MSGMAIDEEGEVRNEEEDGSGEEAGWVHFGFRGRGFGPHNNQLTFYFHSAKSLTSKEAFLFKDEAALENPRYIINPSTRTCLEGSLQRLHPEYSLL